MKIFFLTEAGTNIGYGHITRCLSLFQAFEKFGYPAQMIVNSDVNVSHILPQTSTTIFNWIREKKTCTSLIEFADIVIFDSYIAEASYLIDLSDKVKTPVFIDDFLRLSYKHGIVFNGAIGAENLPYPKNDKIKYLLGVKYQPIRSDFGDVKTRNIKNEVQKIFITVGGNDIHNILPLLAQNIKLIFPDSSLEIVCGNNFSIKQWVENLKDKSITAHFNLSASKMKELMEKCDLAVSAAGQTLYELAATGIPTIAFSVADNQEINLNGWTKAGFILNAGIATKKEFLENLKTCLFKIAEKEIREESSRNGMKLVNGKGGIETVKSILKYHVQQHLLLSEAQEKDIDDVYQLSNDETVRSNSFSIAKIEYSNHVKWFLNKLKDKNSLFIIARIGGIFAGQVRYQIEDNNAVIGISIHKSFRGFGLGEILLSQSIKILKSKFPNTKKIIAHVKTENIASGKMFLKAGYSQVHNPEHLQYEYQLQP